MNEDLPLRRHTASMRRMAFIIGTVVLLISPEIFSSYNHFQISSGEVVSSAPTFQSPGSSSSGEVDPRFFAIIQEASDRYGVEPALIQAIIMAESSYNPKAISRRGARGLMQLMPATAKALGVEDSFNPEHNIHGGVRYFKRLLDRFDGDVSMALAAYNAGSRKVREYKGIPPFKTTHFYIKKVFSYYNRYKTGPDRV
ncbi:MAG: lytic transglycosylase domain-containing protein [Syntrophales bacterium]|nr:lytic transglycosylase domain-containing protein [Syntrophales bacterium]